MKTPEALTVERLGRQYCVSWEDAETGFHVWLNDKREPGETIYKNRKSTRGTRDHRTTKLKVASHPKIAKAIMLLPNDAFERADTRAVEQEQREATERRNRLIAELRDWAERLGFALVSRNEQDAA